jgi:hypothetical protein
MVYNAAKFPSGLPSDPTKPIAVNQDPREALMNASEGMQLPASVTNLIEQLGSISKECMGSSDATLGNVRVDNSSAILAAQKATSAPLELQKRAFEQYVEDSVRIIVDMMCAYYGRRRIKIEVDAVNPQTGQNEKQDAFVEVDFDALGLDAVSLNIDVGAASYWSELVQSQNLDALWERQIIDDPEAYVECIPASQLSNKQRILQVIRDAKQRAQLGQMQQQQAPAQGMQVGGAPDVQQLSQLAQVGNLQKTASVF